MPILDPEIVRIVEEFETAAISEADWHHREHLLAAYGLIVEHGFEAAVVRTREGLGRLLLKFGRNPEQPSPYHETLTVFWMTSIARFIRTNPGLLPEEVEAKLVAEFPSDYPLRFYDKDRLYSAAARERFIEPDRSFPAAG